MTVPHQPKGGMCMSCEKRLEDCSHLPFATMPIIQKHQRFNVVKCLAHVPIRVKP